MKLKDFKMNPDDKTKWVAALRSGEYKQGAGRLYIPETDSYCCLGVAVKAIDNITPPIGQNFLHNNEYGLPFGIQILLSSSNDGEECFKSGMIKCGEKVKREYLAKGFKPPEMNDSGGSNFNQIADWIEKNL